MLASNPLYLAHRYWASLLSPTDTVIDATCGNGHDTLKLAELVPQGIVIALDIQSAAIERTQELTQNHPHVHLFQQCHTTFPSLTSKHPIKLIVYNLGYLPGSADKNLTTITLNTLFSVKNALSLVMPGGALSIMCYPGHSEGEKEETALLTYISALPKSEWDICHHKWVNRRSPPSLLIIQKKLM